MQKQFEFEYTTKLSYVLKQEREGGSNVLLLFRNVAIVEGVEVDNEQGIFVTSFVDIH